MSEQAPEQPQTPATPGGPQDATTTEQAANPSTATAPAATIEGTEFPLRMVKVEDTSRHWNVAKGIWEQVVHAETGDPNFDYALVATIDGVDVELSRWNAGRIDTRVRSVQQAQQAQQTSGA